MRWFAFALCLMAGVTWAQEYGGVYTTEHFSGTLTLELTHEGDHLYGTLFGPGIHFELEGFVYEEDAVAAGAVYTAEGLGGFEAYLEGDTLGLYLFELDENNDPITDSVTELIMTRHGSVAPPRPGDSAEGLSPAPGQANPLAPRASTDATDPWVGTFSDGELTLTLDGEGGHYTGQIEFGSTTYPVTAQGDVSSVAGTFTSNGQAFSFVAALQADTIVFETGGASYRLRRQGAAGVNPLAGPSASGDPVIVRGAHAELTRDNALAFIEAFEFALEQVGYTYRFTEAEREQLLGAIVQEFPEADQMDQVVLSHAREIWTRVKQQWPYAPEAERREFLLGVFVLAFGEEAVQQWVGPGGSGGQGQALGAESCGTFEDCTSRFVDQQTWTDTFNAQGCWAAAGCDSYDSSTGTFTYSDDY